MRVESISIYPGVGRARDCCHDDWLWARGSRAKWGNWGVFCSDETACEDWWSLKLLIRNSSDGMTIGEGVLVRASGPRTIRPAHLSKFNTWKVQWPRYEFRIAGNLRRSHNSLLEALLIDFPGVVVIISPTDPIADGMYGRHPKVSSCSVII